MTLDNLLKLAGIFIGDAEALFNIGDKSCYYGLTDLNVEAYLHLAILAYERALQTYNLGIIPLNNTISKDYAITQNNLGVAYQDLAKIEEPVINCKKAIKAFEGALEIFTLERFPLHYATAWNNLGAAFIILGTVENTATNCKKAIAAYEEALTVYAREPKRFPLECATTWNNLGNAYANLAQVEDAVANCREAFVAFEKALEVNTLKLFPFEHATTWHNLGHAYNILAEVEAKAVNCCKAIEALAGGSKVLYPGAFSRAVCHDPEQFGNCLR
jgi:tetratricopeptide (TPR) repeat protein